VTGAPDWAALDTDLARDATVADDDARATRWAPWRIGALAALGAVFVWQMLTRGVPLERNQWLLWIAAALVVATIGRPDGGVRRVVADFLPLAILLLAYDYSRGLADDLGMPLQMQSLVDAEQTLFGGTIPTVWIQERLGPYAGPARWWEVPVALVYLSHFVASFAVLGVLWVRDRDAFTIFRKWFLTLTAAGLVTYALVPAAPPWMAADNGLIGPVERVGLRGMDMFGLELAAPVLRLGARAGNAVAALPSLHGGWAALIAIFLASRMRSPWRWALALYPLWMGAALVMSGEHYVVDVLCGYAYAIAVAVFWTRWDRRQQSRSKTDAS
jgi:membrane-associated phospholipid phosphatase